MKRSISSHRVVAAACLCCLIALLQVQGMPPMDRPEVSHHGQPSRRCRLLYNNLQLLPPPPMLSEEIGTRFGTEERRVPGGPNPLHN
ncbi:hypothetical protein L1987_14000 [Smallanthus sonchifolius]|uniref:Uncharacterized protein n=1 Tax=Smallanthus sonchifolius TaxID=185202 RepID=A0ACB9JJ39_9ASTR|nr:hypothetical protein L1987_14000 [Smallanthus sonchifolius]